MGGGGRRRRRRRRRKSICSCIKMQDLTCSILNGWCFLDWSLVCAQESQANFNVLFFFFGVSELYFHYTVDLLSSRIHIYWTLKCYDKSVWLILLLFDWTFNVHTALRAVYTDTDVTTSYWCRGQPFKESTLDMIFNMTVYNMTQDMVKDVLCGDTFIRKIAHNDI